jgi:hypothetical protein
MGILTTRPTLQRDSLFARTSKSWPTRYPRTSTASTRAGSKTTAEVPHSSSKATAEPPPSTRPRTSQGLQADAGLLPQHLKQLKASSAPAAVDTSNSANAATQAAAAATLNALRGGHFAFCVHPQKEHTDIGHNVELQQMQIDETQLTIKGLPETITARILAATETVDTLEHLIEEQKQDLQGPRPLRRRRERRQSRNRGAGLKRFRQLTALVPMTAPHC